MRGSIYTFTIAASKINKQNTSGKPLLKYAIADPILGEIQMYKSELDFSKKSPKVEQIKMQNILCIWGPSGRSEMKNNGVDHSMEINFRNETILLLGAHEKTQLD